jgi:hypothetical protein
MSVTFIIPENPVPILRLTGSQIENPYQVLTDFFSDINLTEIRKAFDKILETCMATDDGPFARGEERSQLLYLLRKIEQVLEADFLIFGSRENMDAQ